MFCPKCGSQMNDTARFCQNCGSSVQQPVASPRAQAETAYAPTITVDPEPQQIGSRVALFADGKYRWVYEYSLFRHPGIFLLIWKIFFFIMVGIFGFMLIVTAFQGDLNGESVLDWLKHFGIALLVMTALVGVSYLIYAALMGGKYIVLFEMDEDGVNHKQIEKQARKARKIAGAAFSAGALAGSRGAMLAGMTARTEMYTSFRSTGRVKPYPKKNLIKIREALNHNQIFVHPDDYAFVLDYILARVPDKAKPGC